jgi:3-dehydroquinate synthase
MNTMNSYTYTINDKRVNYYFYKNLSNLKSIVGFKNPIVIIDENVFHFNTRLLSKFECIVIPSGEEFKNQRTVDFIVDRLIYLGADRSSQLIGIGGGVVTDITGYVASIYMRGIDFGFVPTTLLSMVDASIGGKNGIDIGIYKNMIGNIRQPSFIFYDFSLLNTLPNKEIINGFAEIIKHACVKDKNMFKYLENFDSKALIKNKDEFYKLIQQNVLLKTKVVTRDEKENGERKLLNFGHTLGHAIENMYQLSHGYSVSIGMVYACKISENQFGFKETNRVINLLKRYELPTEFKFDKRKVFENMKKDKKKENDRMNYILLEKIGKGYIESIALLNLKQIILN